MTMNLMSQGETAALARWAADFSLDTVPESTIAAAQACILDSLACTIGGIHTEPCQLMLELFETLDPEGTVAIAGTKSKLSLLKAAYLMSQAANALDFDDSFRKGAPSHPGATVIPPALALGIALNSSGRDFLKAVIIGYEVSLRVGRAIQSTAERDRQIFGFSTWQSFGAVSAAASLLGLNAAQTQQAYGLSALHAPVAGNRKGGFGESGPIPWLKNNYGPACEGGIWAALLAQKGYRGHSAVLEGPSGFWVMAGSDQYQPDRITEGLGETWLIEAIGFKPYACCRWTHTMLDGLRVYRQEHAGKQISRITMSGFREFSELGQSYPSSIIDAQFNPRYLAALELLDKSPSRGLFETDLSNTYVKELFAKMTVQHDPEADIGFYRDATLPVHLAIETEDGARIEISRTDPSGGSKAGGFSRDALEQKFLRLTGRVLDVRPAERLLEEMRRLEDVKLRQLSLLMTPAA